MPSPIAEAARSNDVVAAFFTSVGAWQQVLGRTLIPHGGLERQAIGFAELAGI